MKLRMKVLSLLVRLNIFNIPSHHYQTQCTILIRIYFTTNEHNYCHISHDPLQHPEGELDDCPVYSFCNCQTR